MKDRKNLIYYLIAIIAILISCSDDTDINEPNNITEKDSTFFVFEKEKEGYAAYRCPAMVITQESTLLAFCEGRVNDWADEGDIDLVMKRSNNGGKTWSSLKVLENDGLNPCKNPVPVILPSGRIILLWLWNKSIPSESYRTTRDVYITYSDDDGVTWSSSRNITSQVYMDNWGWYGIGPGHGIVKELEPAKGRIIIGSRHNGEGINMTSHIIYSDDYGENWNIGAVALRDRTTESTAVELSNGEIMLNSRNGNKEQNRRVVHISSDGGIEFDRMYLDMTLTDADGCHASILKHSMNEETGKYNILFSNPDNPSDRTDGTLKLSNDDGMTWVKKIRYSKPYPAFSGYSDIAVMNNGDVAVLYETGSNAIKQLRYDGIAFKIVRFNEISEPIN